MEHDRHPVDHHVEETAKNEAEEKNNPDEEFGVVLEVSNDFGCLHLLLNDRAHLEDGEVHGDDEAADEYAQYRHDERLHQTG